MDTLEGIGPLDWLYGIKLSYSVPDLGCERCAKSGGTCGFDVETQGFLCICSASINATIDCGNEILNASSSSSPSIYTFFFSFF